MFTKTALLVLVASLTFAAEKGPENDKEEQLADIFDSLDADNDGKISLKEAKTFYGNIGLNDAAIEKAFAKADKNGDKSVSKEEFQEYSKDISLLKEGDILATVFDSIDKDNDNYITLDEVKKFYTTFGIPVADIEADFKSADKDKDGKLSEEEFKEYADKN